MIKQNDIISKITLHFQNIWPISMINKNDNIYMIHNSTIHDDWQGNYFMQKMYVKMYRINMFKMLKSLYLKLTYIHPSIDYEVASVSKDTNLIKNNS